MAANPILPSEIESYKRQTFLVAGAWLTKLILRMDRAVLKVLNPAPDSDQIPVKNTPNLASRMRANAAVHNARFKKPEEPVK